MPVSRDELQKHLDDYAEVTGQKVGKFVCPITERLCEESELIDGHILNEALINASRATVIQYGDVDNYYGRTVEPDFISFANIRKRTATDLINDSRRLLVTFDDGTTAEGFFSDPSAAAAFPRLHISRDGLPVDNFYVRLPKDDPHITQTSAQIEWNMKFNHMAWTATLVKSAYLALFRKLGYRHYKVDASGEYIRQSLSAFYTNRATKQDAVKYFWQFRNAVKVGLREDGTPDTDKDVPDTLAGDTYFFHFRTRDDQPFAISLRFKINDLLTTVTLPATLGNDPEPIRTYSELMEDETAVDQYIRWTVFKDGRWNMNTTKHKIMYRSDPKQT